MPSKVGRVWKWKNLGSSLAPRVSVALILGLVPRVDSQLMNYTQFLASGISESLAQSEAVYVAGQARIYV